MRSFQVSGEKFYFKRIHFLFFLSFFIWLFLFRGFFLKEFLLVDDAYGYYQHFKFYLDNIKFGVYPLWESTRHEGVPAEFFLRRIGSFNPLYLSIIVIDLIGFTYTQSYILFLAFYYFLGVLGFYFLAKKLFHNADMAFLASLALMFSSLGINVFHSFIILSFVPMVWFIYFLISFHGRQNKRNFLGCIFTLMIILSTYIPFYFITLFLIFAFFYTILYFKSFKKLLKDTFYFFQKYKIFVSACLVLVVLATIPGFLLFQEAKQGELVFPVRQVEAIRENAMEVDIERVKVGGIILPNIIKDLFSNFRNFQLGRFYIPPLVYVFLLLGCIVPITKRRVLWCLWGMTIFIIGLADATPLYTHLYKYVFYFKFFRNLHFFLWYLIIPLIILFAVDVLQSFQRYCSDAFHKKRTLTFIIGIHVIFAVFLYDSGTDTLSLYATIIFSLSVFAMYVFNFFKNKAGLYNMLLMLLIIVHPLNAFHYLVKNIPKASEKYHYIYENKSPYRQLKLPESKYFEEIDGNLKKVMTIEEERRVKAYDRKFSMYMGTAWYYSFRQNFNWYVLDRYFQSRLLVYDRIEVVQDIEPLWDRMEKAFIEKKNVAFVFDIEERHSVPNDIQNRNNQPSRHVLPITQDSKWVEIISSDSNQLKLKTHFAHDKFLVYNDNFHSRWHAFIDGKEVDIYRANIAFKGLWVPKGDHVVHFRYGEPWQYLLNYFLVFVFLLCFGLLVYFTLKRGDVVNDSA